MNIKKVFYVTNPKVKDKYLIPSIIESFGDSVSIFNSKEKLSEAIELLDVDLIICDRPTFLLSEEQIEKVKKQCFNIHLSFLPYNRGYHSNLWSFIDNTPSGVTIHNIDKGIDTGRIVSQIRLTFSDEETLHSTYIKLRDASIALFKLTYPILQNGYDLKNTFENIPSIGNTNYKKESEKIILDLPNGWDTNVGFVRNMKK